MSNSVKKTKRQIAFSIAIEVFIMAIIIGVILLLNSGREKKTVVNNEGDLYNTLVCVNNDDENSFYKSGIRPISVSHEIRIVLKNDLMDKISIKYTGVYESEAMADESSAFIHASHNELLGGNNIPEDIFSSNFSKKGNKLVIELFGETKNINSITSKLFYIGQNEFNKIKSFSGVQIKNVFENKGFSCTFQE